MSTKENKKKLCFPGKLFPTFGHPVLSLLIKSNEKKACLMRPIIHLEKKCPKKNTEPNKSLLFVCKIVKLQIKNKLRTL